MEAVLDSVAGVLAGALALPMDQARYTMLLLGNIVLGWVFASVPCGPNARHLFSIVVSFYSSWYLFGWTCLHAIGTSLATYLAMIVLPRQYSHHVVFAALMAYLSGVHIYRMYTDYMGWSMDFSTTQMLTTLRLTMVAVNYSHGDPAYPAKASTKPSAVSAAATYKKHALRDLPSPLEFFGYAFCFTTFLAGPVIEYDVYIAHSRKNRPGENSSERAVATALRFGWFLLSAAVFIVMMPLYPLAPMFNPEFGLAHSPLYRIVYGYVACFPYLFKYIAGWLLAEAACVASGLGHSGVDPQTGRHQWDACTNVRVRGLVFAQSVKGPTDNWNIGVSLFLRDYVYIRGMANGLSQMQCTALTQILCAFWHGFYLSYYFVFISLTAYVTVARGMRAKLRHLVVRIDPASGKELGGIYPLKYAYDFGGFVVVSATTMYSMGMLQTLSYSNTMGFLRNESFFVHIATAVGLLVVRLLPGPRRVTREITSMDPLKAGPKSKKAE